MAQFRWTSGLLLAGAVVLSGMSDAQAQDAYKIGMSAGLTGYAATVDRAWRDGVEVAFTALPRAALVAARSNWSLRTIVRSRRRR